MKECDAQIDQTLASLTAEKPEPETPLPKPPRNKRQSNAVSFDARSPLYHLTGIDLTQIHGIGPYLALRLVSECGTDLSR